MAKATNLELMKFGSAAAKSTDGGRYYEIDSGYHGDWPSIRGLGVDPLEASVDGQGGTIRDKPVFTADEAAFYLNRGDGLITVDGVTYETGAQWYGAKGGHNDWYFLAESKADNDGTLDTLTFGFYETQMTLPEPYIIRLPDGSYVAGMNQALGFSAFTGAQREAARQAIEMWDEVMDVEFIETHFSEADMNFMNTTTGPIQASAYLPYDYGDVTYTNGNPVINYDGEVVTNAEISGDVYINPNQASNHQFDEGEYGLTTLIHELGHSLGLQHPGNYNFSADFAATYENGAEYYQDSLQYSIMSYWGAEETGAAHVDWSTLQFVYASTPMVHDILAIQRIYGTDTTTRIGNTTYGFNSNAGHDAFDFNLTPLAVVTIWDTGGIDTLDLSGYDTNSTININEGQFSSAGGSGVVSLEELKANGVLPESYTQAQYDALRAAYNAEDGLLHDNISIAYGVTIENARGGGGDDTMIGNGVNNRLDGGAGDDTITAGAGNDTLIGAGGIDVLDGGAGIDTVSYETSTSGVVASLTTNSGTGGDAAGDKLVSIEYLFGSNFGDTLSGSAYNDTLAGFGGADTLVGANGNDKLYGGSGDDTVDGGNGNDMVDGGVGNDTLRGGNNDDTLIGGAGNDTLFGGNGNDIFVFSDAPGNDTIRDFRSGQDKVDLRQMDAISGGSRDAFTFIGSDEFSNSAGELRSYRVGSNAFVAGDTNGDGTADFVINTSFTQLAQADIIFA